MNLEQLGRRDGHLDGLLRQSRQWRRLDGEVKKILPANLGPHFQTACVEGGRLVLLATNAMAASRLKMILPAMLPKLKMLRPDIEEAAVRVVPKTPAPQKANRLRLSDAALESLEHAAQDVRGRHPELAAALADMVGRHRNGSR